VAPLKIRERGPAQRARQNARQGAATWQGPAGIGIWLSWLRGAARREVVRHEVRCKVPGAVRRGSERVARHCDGGAAQSDETRRQGSAARQMAKRCGAAAKHGGASAAEQADERVHYCGLVLGCTWPGRSCGRSWLFPDCVTVGRCTCSEQTGDATHDAVAKAKRRRGEAPVGRDTA
jgi:hypothetical protein